MEIEVRRLLFSLGYNVVKEPVIQPNIDKVISFIGDLRPKPKFKTVLNQPLFSPDGIIAVSIKKGNFSDTDITRLLKDIEEAKKDKEDYTLQNITGGLIISNMMLLPSDIDKIFERGIYCWDMPRLLFYSTKVQKYKLLSGYAPVREKIMDVSIKSSYIRQFRLSEKVDNTINATFVIFIDKHDSRFIYSNDHHNEIMEYIYEKEIKKQIENSDMNVNSKFEIHVLGKANSELVRTAHIDFTQKNTKSIDYEIGASFEAYVPVFHYGVAPWAVLI